MHIESQWMTTNKIFNECKHRFSTLQHECVGNKELVDNNSLKGKYGTPLDTQINFLRSEGKTPVTPQIAEYANSIYENSDKESETIKKLFDDAIKTIDTEIETYKKITTLNNAAIYKKYGNLIRSQLQIGMRAALTQYATILTWAVEVHSKLRYDSPKKDSVNETAEMLEDIEKLELGL